jgi:hypothetical protein
MTMPVTLPAVMGVCLLSGCVMLPVSSDGPQPQIGGHSSNKPLRIGCSTRDDVVRVLGGEELPDRPDVPLVYEYSVRYEYRCLGFWPVPDYKTFEGRYVRVDFDPQGRLRGYKVFKDKAEAAAAGLLKYPPHQYDPDSARIDAGAAVARIRNSDIDWDGTMLGLVPDAKRVASARALSFGLAAVPALIDAIDDPARFVAAHVLLTMITGNYNLVSSPSGAGDTGERWNGLTVHLDADGRTTFDQSDIPVLGHAWRESYTNRGQ